MATSTSTFTKGIWPEVEKWGKEYYNAHTTTISDSSPASVPIYVYGSSGTPPTIPNVYTSYYASNIGQVKDALHRCVIAKNRRTGFTSAFISDSASLNVTEVLSGDTILYEEFIDHYETLGTGLDLLTTLRDVSK